MENTAYGEAIMQTGKVKRVANQPCLFPVKQFHVNAGRKACARKSDEACSLATTGR